MALLIDGYNVIFAAGWLGRGNPSVALRQARKRLERLLTSVLPPQDVSRTTIVYDSQQALHGGGADPAAPRLDIRFSHGFADADELIELLIAGHSVPKQLLVVSSDHRLQQAARRRRARFIDSEPWLAEMERRQHYLRRASAAVEPPAACDENDVDYWLGIFGPAHLDELPSDDIFPPGYAEQEDESDTD